MFKVIVAGSRHFDDYPFLCWKLDRLLAQKIGDIEIVCGMARGADSLGEQYAKERGDTGSVFPRRLADSRQVSRIPAQHPNGPICRRPYRVLGRTEQGYKAYGRNCAGIWPRCEGRIYRKGRLLRKDNKDLRQAWTAQ